MASAFENICSLETNILKLGDTIGELLERINSIYKEPKYEENRDKTLNLEEILNLITQIRTDMHNGINEIYNEKDYFYLNRVESDLIEKERELKLIGKYFSETLRKVGPSPYN